MTESSAVGGAQNQGPEQNGAKPGDKPGEKPIHQWPDSLTVLDLVTELATEEAAAEMEEKMEKEMDGFRFSASMHHPPPSQEKQLQLAPDMDAAVSAAVWAYQPSDMLYEVLDQEMRQLAQTAADSLPRDQWMRLRQAAKEHLRRHVQDRAAGA